MTTKKRRQASGWKWGLLFPSVAILCLGWPQPAESKCECEKKMAAILEGQYSLYSDNTSEMEFDFDVKKRSRHVEVGLLGRDFDSKDQDWIQKNDDSFSSYLSAVGHTVQSEMEKPMVRLHVIGQDGEELVVYRYE